ncbi:MAG TPA: DUF4398 domain-containing protein [Permianibacter sp.]|nr:DUF4398 domain-containing protein [Permianibacter sp.]
MNLSMIARCRRRPLAGWKVTGSAALLVLMACASKPQPPLAAMQAAERAIVVAERAQVQGHQSADLSEARSKLGRSRSAVQQENMVLARWLADEATVSADLATARAEHVKAQAINADMQRSIDALREETQRNAGERK